VLTLIDERLGEFDGFEFGSARRSLLRLGGSEDGLEGKERRN
jgi:hypothetical protein